uniref:Cdk5 and Abl enzyme substrate 1 n=1 Tax=Cavia porcellus TaxID=10141 RepID=A0A286XH77_CAVPO
MFPGDWVESLPFPSGAMQPGFRALVQPNFPLPHGRIRPSLGLPSTAVVSLPLTSDPFSFFLNLSGIYFIFEDPFRFTEMSDRFNSGFSSLCRRRLISQRSSLETLEDIEENAPLRRCRTLSGSPRPKNFKKIHFIKNMRQHDTRNGRDLKLDGSRQSAGAMNLKEIIGLEGVELGADGKTVSYTQFLLPTNAFGARRNTIDSTSSFSQLHSLSRRSLCIGRAGSTQGSLDTGSDLGEFTDYDPNLLDDPQWPCGKHKRVLIFPSYMTTVIDYVKPSDLKKDMNETFKEKFPHIKLTLSKIRSLKREMRKLAQEDCGFEEPTVAMAFVYFEKLALKGKLNKQNRKLCAGACVLLAAKIGSDLKKHEVKHLIDKLEEKFRLNRRELIAFEFPVLVALEFALHLPEHEVMPHYRRLIQRS